jgi:hypothetical protein
MSLLWTDRLSALPLGQGSLVTPVTIGEERHGKLFFALMCFLIYREHLLLYIYYSLSKKFARVTVFWITFARNKTETCGFHRSTANVKRHLFTSKNFSGAQSRSWLCKGSLKKQAGFPKTCIAAYWFFYIFGISIENWVYPYMFRTFSWHFFFRRMPLP